MSKSVWPAWYSSSDGETKIFNSPDEVPKGWTTGAEKQPVGGTGKEPASSPVTTDEDELDSDGHPWSEDLHVSTKTKTKEGLWRLKPGVARPEPVSTTPLDL